MKELADARAVGDASGCELMWHCANGAEMTLQPSAPTCCPNPDPKPYLKPSTNNVPNPDPSPSPITMVKPTAEMRLQPGATSSDPKPEMKTPVERTLQPSAADAEMKPPVERTIQPSTADAEMKAPVDMTLHPSTTDSEIKALVDMTSYPSTADAETKPLVDMTSLPSAAAAELKSLIEMKKLSSMADTEMKRPVEVTLKSRTADAEMKQPVDMTLYPSATDTEMKPPAEMTFQPNSANLCANPEMKLPEKITASASAANPKIEGEWRPLHCRVVSLDMRRGLLLYPDETNGRLWTPHRLAAAAGSDKWQVSLRVQPPRGQGEGDEVGEEERWGPSWYWLHTHPAVTELDGLELKVERSVVEMEGHHEEGAGGQWVVGHVEGKSLSSGLHRLLYESGREGWHDLAHLLHAKLAVPASAAPGVLALPCRIQCHLGSSTKCDVGFVDRSSEAVISKACRIGRVVIRSSNVCD